MTDEPRKRPRWFTPRKLITAVGITISTIALFEGKMSDQVWVYAFAVMLAGHHVADVVASWKGR